MVKRAMAQLPEEARAAIYALNFSQGGKHELDALLGANANSVVVGADGEVHVGLFVQAARINHSCRPNAYYRFSQKRLTMEVVSYTTIEPGEEITITYVPLATKRDVRRQYLQDNWGIDCQCDLCHAPAIDIAESETSRRRMDELKDTILDARREGFFQDAINIAADWLTLSEWERVPPLAPEYHDTLAELYLLNGDMVNATRYARMALDGWVRLGSVDDEQLERSRLLLRSLTVRPEKEVKKGAA